MCRTIEEDRFKVNESDLCFSCKHNVIFCDGNPSYAINKPDYSEVTYNNPYQIVSCDTYTPTEK